MIDDKANIFDMGDYREGEYLFAVLAMCVAPKYRHDPSEELCLYRWVAGAKKEISLFQLECPACGAHNSFASILPSEYLDCFKGESNDK